MLIRFFEYDTQIALDEGTVNGNILTVTLPHSAVLFLRHHASTPETLKIRMVTPGGTVEYDIQVMKSQQYTLAAEYFLTYLSKEQDSTMLIYAVWCTEGVDNGQLRELYVSLLDKYRIHENMKADYKGSQMVLKGGCCMGASRPEGQLVSNLMRQFDYFGLDYRGAWKLLMNGGRWMQRKQENMGAGHQP